jgi:hypothetical protein
MKKYKKSRRSKRRERLDLKSKIFIIVMKRNTVVFTAALVFQAILTALVMMT